MSHYYRQHLLDELTEKVQPKKVVVIYGPRRVGKTTLLEKFLETQSKDYLLVSGEDVAVHPFLASQSIQKLQAFVGTASLLVIDEAQHIPNIGLNLKLLVDHCPTLKIIATGSSSFDLANQLGEPLTGRKITLRMYPLSQIELGAYERPDETATLLESRLIYGSYPEVVLMQNASDRRDYLQELTTSYLYKDILELDGVRQSGKIQQMLRLLAFQIGKEVSLTEIASHLGLHKNTVQRYFDLLEKAFVLIPLHGFSRNLRKEVTKMSKYYFFDVGIRNALINQFNPLEFRSDIGELWENYLVVERLKKLSYRRLHQNVYFWRTYTQQEIDWVEEGDGALSGYEFKWKSERERVPSLWTGQYPEASFSVISRANYLPFIT